MTRTVLVTGGAGYVGSHACKALSDAGWTPVVFDNFNTGQRDAVRWGPLVEGDILDRAVVDRAIAEHAPVAVMHFAALSLVGESVSQPGKYFRNNVVGTLTLLEAMRDHGIGTFVFSSTCATYGIPSQVPIVETTPQLPINPYGASKLMVERMIGDFSAAHGLKGAALRYFNACGADPGGEIGEMHEPETHLIPLALRAALGFGTPLKLFGDDYETPDGTCVRDYIHVSDLAQAHVDALQRLQDGAETMYLNLGTGTGLSVKEIIAAVGRHVGSPVPHDIAPRRAGDPPVLVADARRANAELGWIPSRSDVDTIVSTALAWERRTHNRSHAR